MSNQVLYVGTAFHLCSRLEQLVLESKAEGVESVSRSAENLLMVELDNRQITLTLAALQLLAKNKVVVLVADERHLPGSLIVPFEGNSLQGKVVVAQWKNQEKMAPLLWKEVVTGKIGTQIQALKLAGKSSPRLDRIQVLPADRENAEGQAARIYFSLLFGEDFFRNSDLEGANAFLNYGYGVVRAMMARALVCAGLQLCPGIFHRNQYNPFPLADDMMEPYRPWVDLIVWEWGEKNGGYSTELGKKEKAALLSVLYKEVKMGGKSRPLHQGVQATANSLAQCLMGYEKKLLLPDI